MTTIARYAAAPVLALLLTTLAVPVPADPPSHAPAHGWRKKHDPYYLGYTGRKWGSDYGILGGRCDTGALGAALGGLAGAAIGHEVGGDTGAVIGAIAGVLLGAQIDREMGPVDRGCVSHALDLGPDGQRVSWSSPGTARQFGITPYAPRTLDGRTCRDFAWDNGTRQTACLRGDGTWSVD